MLLNSARCLAGFLTVPIVMSRLLAPAAALVKTDAKSTIVALPKAKSV